MMSSDAPPEHDAVVQERLQLLVDETVDYAIFALDPSGIIISWNAGAKRIKGYEPAEIIGQHFSVFYPAEAQAQGVPARGLEIAKTEGVFTEEGWRVRRNGAAFWASVTITALRDRAGTLRGFGKVTRDLSQRKVHDDALRAAEERFRLAFDAAPTGMALLSLDGRWLRVNDALCEILHRSVEELSTMSAVDMLDLTATEETSWFEPLLHRHDLPISQPDGSEIWVQATVGVVTDGDSHPSHLILHLDDITARMLVAQRLEEAERAKSRFVAVTSHELRTPLTSIIGYAELLIRRKDQLTEERQLEFLQLVTRQARRLRLLVEDLLTLSAVDTAGAKLASQAVNLSDLIRDVVHELDVTADVTGEVDVSIDADPLRISQIMSNLLTNCVKYGRPPYGVHVSRGSAAVDIVVSDHGDGVDPSFVPALFERFTQAETGIDRRSDGTGLGLSICKVLTEAHGGTIAYTPTDHGGAGFTVSLPLAPST